MREVLPWTVLGPVAIVAATWLGCVGNPMSGLSFACDPDSTSTCSSGFVCVRNNEGSDPPGVCTPIGSLDAGADPGGLDEGAVDPGIHDLGRLEDITIDPGPCDAEPDDGEDIAEDCPPYWTCETWSVCGCENTQQRTCRDENGCTPGVSPKVEHQACDHCGNGACDCDETSETCPMDCLPTVCGETTCPLLAGYVAGCHQTKGSCEYTMGPGPDMIWIPAGAFWMGCNDDMDPRCSCPESDECPYRQVTPSGFWIDKFEVTVAAYQTWLGNGALGCQSWSGSECVEATGEDCFPGQGTLCNDGEKARHPRNCINWCEARSYCQSRGTGYRLCSEAEWEKAARGTDGWLYPWGNTPEPTCDRVVMQEAGVNGCGKGTTSEVGSKPDGASPFGLLDMSGNVFEWVEDDWHDSYLLAPTSDGMAWNDNPRGLQRCGRGGSYAGTGSFRSSHRSPYSPDFEGSNVGFRCCMSRLN